MGEVIGKTGGGKDTHEESRFNLVDEVEWVPTTSGRLTLSEAFNRAEDIEGLSLDAGSVAMVETLRLMLAVAYRAGCAPRDQYDTPSWADALVKINAYLNRMHDRFYLVDDEHPFGQSAYIYRAIGDNIDTVMKDAPMKMGFIQRSPSDMDGYVHFVCQPTATLAPEDVALRILDSLMSGVSGIHTGIPGAPAFNEKNSQKLPWLGVAQSMTFLTGETLAETIQANLLPTDEGPVARTTTGDDDLPWWEYDVIDSSVKFALPPGVVSVLAPPTRVNVLRWDGDRVNGMKETEVVRFTECGQLETDYIRMIDPYTPWTTIKDDDKKSSCPGGKTVNTSMNSGGWRGLASMIAVSGAVVPGIVEHGASFETPPTVNLYTRRREGKGSLYGETMVDSIRIPERIIRDEDAEEVVRQMYADASELLKISSMFCRDIQDGVPKSLLDNIESGCARHVSLAFREIVARLDEDEVFDFAHTKWVALVADIIRKDVFRSIQSQISVAAQTKKGFVDARRKSEQVLWKKQKEMQA